MPTKRILRGGRMVKDREIHMGPFTSTKERERIIGKRRKEVLEDLRKPQKKRKGK